MQNAVVYHIASGQAFFSGIALIHLALLLSLRTPGRWRALTRTVSACLGSLLIVASASPMPLWLGCLAGAATLAWFVVEGSSRTRARHARPWLRSAVVVLWWIGIAFELPYHWTPHLPRTPGAALDVIGDSVSAGMGRERATWPGLLADEHGVVVHNLSLAGSDGSKARSQAARVAPSALVLLEIGGNDILAGTPLPAFERDLDALVAQIHKHTQNVVMLELPLPPFFNRYGAIQRRLAKRHGAPLVPKRVLLGVLTTEGATVDSIHLSPAGHRLMARSIWEVVQRAFSP